MYKLSKRKIVVPIGWTKYVMTTHPIVFITTIGKVGKQLIAGVAPFATCLDTSYEPPYVTFSAACRQHSIAGGPIKKGKMNTYLNILQYKTFIVNIPGRDLLKKMDVVAVPYDREEYRDKISSAGLTKAEPVQLSVNKIYPPLIEECLVHLECEVIDIHRPKGSDHRNITGKVVAVLYDKKLGKDIDQIRRNLVKQTFHHFGSNTKIKNERFIAFNEKVYAMPNTTIFHLEKNKK